MELRPYQIEARDAVLAEWAKGARRTLLVLPTGTGKTIVFSSIIEDRVCAGDRVLVLAHRGELLQQAADKLRRSTGLACSVEKAEQTSAGCWERVTVGSVQTLCRDRRLQTFAPDRFGTIIVDEAHHAVSDSYRRVLDWFGGAKVLGVTATPDRGDMRNLGQYFETLAYEYGLPRAILEGWLCPIRALTVPLQLDMTKVGTAAGDYKAGDIATALDPYLEQIADVMAERCRGRRTVVFLPLIATSKKFLGILQARGLRCAEVNGGSEDRAEILADFAAGRTDVLLNSMLLTEGWDCPAVDCIVVLRPTKSRSLYCQMVGRGTRIAPDKDHLLLLDFLWQSQRHELCRPACLICDSPEVSQRMTKNLEDQAMTAEAAADLEEAARTASEDVIRDREEALAEQLRAMRKRKQRLVDPLQYEMSIHAEDLADYIPAFGWQMAPASDGQKATLEKLGIDPDGIESAGKASLLLDRLAKRRDTGLTTPKQIRFLEGRGFRDVGMWPFEAARKLIDRIAANGWKTPPGIVPQHYVPEEVGA